MSIETQTEAFMDRPPSPLFVPAKSGVDADTQVVVGELFEFDLEVKRIGWQKHKQTHLRRQWPCCIKVLHVARVNCVHSDVSDVRKRFET